MHVLNEDRTFDYDVLSRADACHEPGRLAMNNIIIILGAARSGTKLLRDAIAQSRRVDAVPYDINYVWKVGNEGYPNDALPRHLANLEDALRIRKFVYRFKRRRENLIVEKTVSNTLRVEFVAAIFPGARFIHLIRDGLDVVESAMHSWQSSPPVRYLFKKAVATMSPLTVRYFVGRTLSWLRFDASQERIWGPRYPGVDSDIRTSSLEYVCARQWQESVERTLEGLSNVSKSRVLTVRYEDFVRDPNREMVRIMAFVGSEYVDQLRSNGRGMAITDSNIGKGQRALSARQKKVICRVIEDTRARLGYKERRP